MSEYFLREHDWEEDERMQYKTSKIKTKRLTEGIYITLIYVFALVKMVKMEKVEKVEKIRNSIVKFFFLNLMCGSTTNIEVMVIERAIFIGWV